MLTSQFVELSKSVRKTECEDEVLAEGGDQRLL